MTTLRFGFALVLCWAAGCGGGDKWVDARPKVCSVRGKVLLDGNPVEGATVEFVPDGGTHSAYAKTDAEGRFSLTTFEEADGAVPGDYKVAVTKKEYDYKLNPENPEGPPLYYKVIVVVPEKYGTAQKSGLTATVTDSGEDEFVFQLLTKA